MVTSFPFFVWGPHPYSAHQGLLLALFVKRSLLGVPRVPYEMPGGQLSVCTRKETSLLYGFQPTYPVSDEQFLSEGGGSHFSNEGIGVSFRCMLRSCREGFPS